MRVLAAGVVAALVGTATAGGLAFGAGSSEPATITACVARSDGAVRVPAATRCKASERRLRWNSAGKRGATGARGATGTPGALGPAGPAGPAGAPGERGTPGATGPPGAQGPQGAPGAQGATGSAGASGTQSVVIQHNEPVTVLTAQRDVSSVTLPAGSWLLVAHVGAASRSTGYARLECRLTTPEGELDFAKQRVPPNDGGIASLVFTDYSLTGATTVADGATAAVNCSNVVESGDGAGFDITTARIVATKVSSVEG